MSQIFSYFSAKPGLFSLFVIVCLFCQSAVPSSVQAEEISGQNDPAPLLGSIAGCPMFPDNNIWNTPVHTLPVHSRSDQWVNSIGRNTGFHMDFGSGTWDGGPIGIPYNIVGAGMTKVPVSFDYEDESDPGPYPIPANPKIEHGSDHHILIVDNSTCTLYELFDASYSGGSWYAGSGAIWDLNSNALRPDTWTSADAAGLPILPGLVRYEEILSGKIDHAIRFTASNTNGYIWPARHLTSNNPAAPHIPPMGARFRLKSSFNVSGYPPHMQVILTAMKTYGIILADNGSNWYVSGAPDPRWDNDMLHLLDDLTGDDFEAVNTSLLMVNYNSGAAGKIISGNTGVAGVTLSYNNGGVKTALSNASGNYSIIVPYGWSGSITPSKASYTFSPASRSYSNVTANQTAQNYTAVPFYSISGNTDVAGVTLNYTVSGTPKSVISQANGSYILQVPGGWSGTVMPSHHCFTFSPSSLNYSNVTTNQTAQNYTATFDSSSGCADIDVRVGGADQGSYGLLPGASTRTSFPTLNNGPVEIASSNGIPLIGAERVIYKVNSAQTSFSEMMGLPHELLDTTYWLPWYNNVDLDTQLRIANATNDPATVTVTIGGMEMPTLNLAAGESTRVSYPDVNDGPVQIVSDRDIVAAERVIYTVQGTQASFSEMMALPDTQLDSIYWLPWYNNVDLDTQLRFANATSQLASVHVYIGGVEMTDSPFTLEAGQSIRASFPGINDGPVQIVSDQNVVAAERVIYKVKGVHTSFTEMMALPNSQLDTTYWLPWYNNVDLDTQLRFANTTDQAATVHIYVGDQEMPDSPFLLAAGESTRQSFAATNNGPVQIVSDVPIVVAERVIYKVNGVQTSFSEMMALPDDWLSTSYWLPWYNNAGLDTQLRFGVP
ncbi:MAG TPA: hypothetical protein VFH34_04605 [Anaerolineales bacterium]|nr:hypothetical protein [Anaerolineales bacterium]